MKKPLRIAAVLLLAASLAGCEGPCQKIGRITGPALTAGSADFTRYVAVGTSISAGYQSGGVVNRHQVTSFPARFAQQIGYTVTSDGTARFSFDAIGGDGFLPLLQLRSLSPLVISNTGLTNGTFLNYAQGGDYQNLGVPGAVAFQFADTTWYDIASQADPRFNPYFLFAPVTRHRGSIAAQLLRQGPTFISWEYGANEVLGPAHAGNANVPFSAAQYAAILTGAMNAIHLTVPNAKLALFTVPDVTGIPFCTTFKPYTVSLTTGQVVPLVGLDPAKDLVLLTASDTLASGTGFPVGGYNYLNPAAPGNGRALPDKYVLTSAEVGTLQAAVTAMNAAIDSVATRPWIARVDMGGLLSDIAANGYWLGSTKYTSDFVTGGVFSLDGVHPTDLGQAVLANTMIDAVNARFGSTIPRVDVSSAASVTASSLQPARGTDVRKGMQVSGLGAGLDAMLPGGR